MARANSHLIYIAKMAEPLSWALFNRPWGIGFSDACLLTSDVPVLILNGQDHNDQMLAAEYWDVYVPLDPHRCLYLPGVAHRRRANLGSDHRFKLDGGIGFALNQAIADTAMKQVFFHPDHSPLNRLDLGARLDTPGSIQDEGSPKYQMHYERLPNNYSVERRWLYPHNSVTHTTNEPRKSELNVEILEEAMRHLDEDVSGFETFKTNWLPGPAS